MIAPVSSIHSSSAVLASSSPFSYLQLFELKAQKLRDEYLKNRGCPVHYRNWIAHLASAQKWEAMREAILSYRHDSAEFDPLNAFYLAKLDKELENDHKASFELMMFYHLSFPDDIESIFILSSLAVDTKATPINDNRLVKAIRLILNSEIARLQKECDKELKTYDWLEEFSLFMNSKHAPSRMARVPVFVFIEILKHVANRVNPARVAAFDEEISFQIKQNPFEARLLAYALLYYVILQDHTKADSLFKRLSELADNPSCEVIFALAKYESLKGNSVKALEWVSNDRAINLACCNLRLNLLSALGRNEEWMQLFEKIDKAFSYPKALTPSRIWFFEKKAKQSLNDNKLDDAEKYINEILKIDPKNKNALHALVLVYLKRKKYKEAWSYFESKQKEAPSEKDFFIAALIAKRSYMRLCETEAFLKANIRFNENADELTIAIIDLLICQSKYQEALDYVAKLSKLDDNQKIMRDVIRLRMGIPPVMSLDELKKGVIGQNEAITKITKAIQ
ncbi:MAG: tetratricopeptide repeat protein, partial [Parachlamydiaceae bacterium]